MKQASLFEIYFRDIRNIVRKDIQNATTSILAAVAWFTDDYIFSDLIKAAQRGVRVEIIMMDDEINKNSGLEYTDLEHAGVKVWCYDVLDQTMHLKMCLVDEEILHSGSYNWTRKAATRNRESLTRMQISADPVSRQYFDEFEQIKSVCYRKYALANTQSGTSGSISIPDPEPVIYTGPTMPSLDGTIVALRHQIGLLELEIASLETEKQSRLSLVETFERRLRILLADLLSRQLELQAALARIKASLTGKTKDQEVSREKEESFKSFRRQITEDYKKTDTEVPPEQKYDMRKMYREAIHMAHPDRFQDNPEKEAEANRIVAALTEAYRNNDLDQVRTIYEALKNGTAFNLDWQNESDISLLQKLLARLLSRRDGLMRELEAISESETWIIIQDQPDVDEYAERVREQLQLNIQILENEIKNYKI